MQIHLEIHPTQAEIMRGLLFVQKARFSELNTQGLSSDSFSFHLRRLMALGVVEKLDERYGLTLAGKEFANRLDTDKRVMERQAKVAVMVVPVRDEGAQRCYLVQERLKQPYFGYYGFLTGKVRWGETVLEGAARELEEETGLRGQLQYLGTQHKLDYAEDGALLEDKYFFVVKASELVGDLMEVMEGGRNLWLSRDEILDLALLFKGMDTSLALAEGGVEQFSEVAFKYKASDY